MYDYTFFNGQVVTIPPADIHPSSGSPSSSSQHLRQQSQQFQNSSDFMGLKTILDIVRSIDGWLSLSDRHVAYIHCTNGIVRTGIHLLYIT
jgi:protein tyrosine phosphatase